MPTAVAARGLGGPGGEQGMHEPVYVGDAGDCEACLQQLATQHPSQAQDVSDPGFEARARLAESGRRQLGGCEGHLQRASRRSTPALGGAGRCYGGKPSCMGWETCSVLP